MSEDAFRQAALQAALEAASGQTFGRPVGVFPCVENTKHPAVQGGFHAATTDPAQIRKWFGAGAVGHFAEQDCNVAIWPGGAGLTVLDVDPKNSGLESLEALQLSYGDEFADTYTNATPSDGGHLFFVGATPRNSAGKLAPGLDTRSERGYVLIPPSRRADGNAYSLVKSAPIRPTPPWLVEALRAPRNASEAPAGMLDLPINVERFEDYMMRQPPAPEGERNDTMTPYVGVAADMGLSRELGSRIIHELWGARCLPPIDPAEIENCGLWSNRQNTGHPLALSGPTSEVFKLHVEALEPTEVILGSERAHGVVVLRDEAMQDARPPVEWLVQGIIPEASTSVFHAPKDQYKSFIASDLALSVAAGVPAFNRFPVRRSGPVVMLLGEGAAGFETQRRPAWRTARGIEPARILPIYTVEGVPLVRSSAEVLAYLEPMRRLREPPVMVVVDTFSSTMAGPNENDAGDAALYLAAVEAIRREFGCAIVTVAHEGKDGSGTMRGSSATPAGFEVEWRVVADTTTHAAKLVPIRIKDDARGEPIALQGHVVSTLGRKPSLVFDWSESYAGHELDNLQLEVAQALKELNAVDRASGVSTDVLAEQLTPMAEGESAEDRLERVKKRNARLRSRVRPDRRTGRKGSLLAYVLWDEDGEPATVNKSLLWFLPADGASE